MTFQAAAVSVVCAVGDFFTTTVEVYKKVKSNDPCVEPGFLELGFSKNFTPDYTSIVSLLYIHISLSF